MNRVTCQQIWILQGRSQRTLGQDEVSKTFLRPIDPSSPFAELLIRAAHLFAPSHLHQAALGLLSLHVYLKHSNERLRSWDRECTSCILARGRRDRADDRVKLLQANPCDYLQRALGWRPGRKTFLGDLAGPLKLQESGSTTKAYCLLLLEQPLKILHLRLLRDYTAEALYLCLLSFSQTQLENFEVFVSDRGSQLNVLTHDTLGFDSNLGGEESCIRTQWQRLALGQKGKKLAQQGISLRLVQGRHASVGAVEKCVDSFKGILARHDSTINTALDFQEWNYVFSLVEKSCLTRPLAKSATGRIWSAQDFLRLLSQRGNLLDKPFLSPVPTAPEVIARFEEVEQQLLQLRETLAPILIELAVKPALYIDPVKGEKVKRRHTQSEVTLGSIFFCPRLFRRTFNTSSSLLKLIKVGRSRSTGLFLKPTRGKHKSSDFVTRGIEALHLVTTNPGSITFGNEFSTPESCTPEFSFNSLLQGENMEALIQFGEPAESELLGLDPDNLVVDTDLAEGHSLLVDIEEEEERQVDELQEEEAEGEVGEDEGEAFNEEEEPRYSRRGRRIKRPERLLL